MIDEEEEENKNWTLYTCLVLLVNSGHCKCNEIEIKYLEKGHTFMSADSFHAQVERSMTQHKNVWTFDDFCECIETSGGTPKVAQLHPTDFRLWENGLSRSKSDDRERPLLKTVRSVKFVKGSSKLHFKCTLTQEHFQSCNFLKANLRQDLECPQQLEMEDGHVLIDLLPVQRQTERGIQSSKQAAIVRELCLLMPLSKRDFWTQLRQCDATDLLTHNDCK